MAIAFQEIPETWYPPGAHVEIDSSRANPDPSAQAFKILVIGQMLAAGTAAADTPVRVVSADQAIGLFGQGSMLAQMFAALKGSDDITESWAVPMADDVAGVDATGQITITGPATAAGTLNLYIAGRRVRIAVASAATATVVAAALQVAIAADADLPVTAAVNGADDTKVDLTARHAGENGNDIDLRVNYYQGEVLPAGVGVVFTAMSGGSGNPDIGDAIAALGDGQYDIFVCPWTDAANLTALESELTDRFGAMEMIEGVAIAAKAGTHSALGTFGDSRNSEHLCVMGTGKAPEMPHEWAADVAGQVAFQGAIDPARPFQTLKLKRMAPAETDRFTLQEQNLLLQDGVSTFTVDIDGSVAIQTLVTTYNLGNLGVPDLSYLHVNTVLTVIRLRHSARNMVALTFPRHKLADDGNLFGPGQAIVTPKLMDAHLASLAQDWVTRGWVENVDQFIADLRSERHVGNPNRLNSLLMPDLVNQFRFWAGLIQFRL